MALQYNRIWGCMGGKKHSQVCLETIRWWNARRGFRVRNEAWIFGWNSFQMGFSGDLFFISVPVVDFPASISLGRSHLQHFVDICVCVTEKKGEAEQPVSKVRTHHWLECLMRWLHIRSRRWFPRLMNHPLASVAEWKRLDLHYLLVVLLHKHPSVF